LRRILYLFGVLFLVAALGALAAQNPNEPRQISLPTSKSLTLPSPGVMGALNGFAAAMAVSPDAHYAAVLNDGYGTQKNQAHQSIAILDLKTNQLVDFPEDRLAEEVRLLILLERSRVIQEMGSPYIAFMRARSVGTAL
jgi:hypothetical protein